MTDRFNPAPIWRGHLKGLRNRSYTSATPWESVDWMAILGLYGLPLLGAVLAWLFDLKLAGPEALLALFGILTGAFFMAFAQMAAWRDRFSERQNDWGMGELHNRDSLDSAVANILVSIYVASLASLVTVLAMNFGADDAGAIGGLWSALLSFLGLLLFMLIGLTLPRVYAAYTAVNKVRKEMSGLSK